MLDCDLPSLVGRNVIAVNEAHRLCPWASILYWGDDWWHRANRSAIEAFGGMKIFGRLYGPWDEPGCETIQVMHDWDWSDDPLFLAGHSSGFAALNLACLMGAARVFLVGFDMAGVNWHNRYPEERRATEERYALFRSDFDRAKERIAAEVWNCSPNSALEAFPKVSFEAALMISEGRAA